VKYPDIQTQMDFSSAPASIAYFSFLSRLEMSTSNQVRAAPGAQTKTPAGFILRGFAGSSALIRGSGRLPGYFGQKR
jgi:hypothetical protein